MGKFNGQAISPPSASAPGSVAHIHLASDSGAPVAAVEQVEAAAGAGLRGDRHFNPHPAEPFPHWR